MNPEPFAPLTLARILRPWGRRGEVAAEILTDFPERLAALQQVWLSDSRHPPRAVRIQSCRLHLGQAVIHFAGVDTISDAERLRNLEVQVPLGERLPLGPGRYYISDLVGCRVWDHDAVALGTVRDVQGAGAPDAPAQSWQLVVATPRGELLIPLALEICPRIDVVARRIDVHLPEGLRELNREPPERA